LSSKTILSRRIFRGRIKEFDSIGFENRAAPYISVSKVDAFYKDPYPWDNERTELLKPLTEGNWDENDIWQNRIRRMINKLVHKLDALQYHSHSFEHFGGKTEESWKKYIVGNTTMNKIYDDPHLIYIWA
jgi:hypothetical protein